MTKAELRVNAAVTAVHRGADIVSLELTGRVRCGIDPLSFRI